MYHSIGSNTMDKFIEALKKKYPHWFTTDKKEEIIEWFEERNIDYDTDVEDVFFNIFYFMIFCTDFDIALMENPVILQHVFLIAEHDYDIAVALFPYCYANYDLQKLYDSVIQCISNKTGTEKHQYFECVKDGFAKNNDLITPVLLYQKLIDNGKIDGMYKMAIFCHKQKDYKNMIKYYEMMIDIVDLDEKIRIMIFIAEHYLKLEDYKNMLKYYNNVIDIVNLDEKIRIMILIAEHYLKLKDYDNVEKYRLMAIENGCEVSTFMLGYIYHDIDIDKAKKYYLLHIEKKIKRNLPPTHHNLAILYEKTGDFDKYIDHLIKAVEAGKTTTIHTINKYLHENQKDRTNLIKAHKYLDDKNKKRYYQVIAEYIEVKEAMASDIDLAKEECCICLDEKYIVRFLCTHGVCYKCYPNLKKTICPICQQDIKLV